MKNKKETKIKSPRLYRAMLSCRIGCDVIDGKTIPPDGASRLEYAMYNLLSAVEDIAREMMENAEAK